MCSSLVVHAVHDSSFDKYTYTYTHSLTHTHTYTNTITHRCALHRQMVVVASPVVINTITSWHVGKHEIHLVRVRGDLNSGLQ